MRRLSVDQPAREVVRALDLSPHPEGGWFRETFRDEFGCDKDGPEARAASTAIYYLLEADQVSEWHRVDAAEVWHFYAGAPLSITLSPPDGRGARATRLGLDLNAGCQPQLVVPRGWWQTAVSLGGWTLVGCTVAPGFRFEDFELAPPGWRPTV